MSIQAPFNNINGMFRKSQVISCNNSGKLGKLEGLLKRVKLEGEHVFKSTKEGLPLPSFMALVYATIPKLGNGSLMNHSDFAQTYRLGYEGFSLKGVKVFIDISLEDVSRVFRAIINKHGYNYTYLNDPMYIEKIELLWMIIHEKLYLHVLRWISLGMTIGLVVEKMGWTISELRRRGWKWVRWWKGQRTTKFDFFWCFGYNKSLMFNAYNFFIFFVY